MQDPPPSGPEPPSSSHLRLLTPAARVELERRFELIAVLGRGAMGTVLRARDRELEREVALKLPLRGGGERRLERFQREGEITASLQHEGIVRVHSAGVIDDQPWIAYELVVAARPLDQVLPGLPLRRRVELVRDAARALGHAHAQGVVHRDVKPDNLLVDAAGRLKVADFGLAAAEGQERLTQTGAIVGTPHFMSPEQIGGKGGLTPPSDVWALGVVLFEALTGEAPFEGPTFLALAQAIARRDPPRPTSLVPGLPGPLEAICLRALEKAPADRYRDGDELAQDLEAWLGGTPVSASAVGLRLRHGRRRLLLGLATGGALALLLGAAALAGREPGSALPADPAAPATEAAPDPRPGQARARREALLGLELAERLRQAEAWLAEFPGAEGAGEVRALLVGRPRPRRQEAVRQGREGAAHGVWTGPGALLTWGAGEGSVARWSLAPGRLEARWELSSEPLTALALGPERRLVVGDRVGRIRVMELAGPGEDPRGRIELTSGGTILALAAGEGGALVAGGDGWAERIDPGQRRGFSDLMAAVRGIGLLAGERAAIACGERAELLQLGENRVAIHALADGAILHVEQLVFMPTCLAVAPDRSTFAVGTGSGHVLIMDADGRRLLALAGQHAGTLPRGALGDDLPLACGEPVRSLAFTPDGRHLLAVAASPPEAAARRRELRAWELPSGTESWREPELPREPTTLAIDPSGRWAALGTSEGLVEVWSLGE